MMFVELVMPSNHLILGYSLLLMPSIFPSIRVFSNAPTLYMVSKVLEHQLQPQSNEYSGLISFKIDWFDLLAYLAWHRHFCYLGQFTPL